MGLSRSEGSLGGMKHALLTKSVQMKIRWMVRWDSEESEFSSKELLNRGPAKN